VGRSLASTLIVKSIAIPRSVPLQKGGLGGLEEKSEKDGKRGEGE